MLAVPRRLTGIGACFDAASALIDAAEAEAAATVAELDARGAVRAGDGARRRRHRPGRGRARSAGAAGVLKDLERRQKSRATRTQRDALDRALVDLAGFYRDVLAARSARRSRRCTSTCRDVSATAAARWTPESTLRRLEAVLACREAIELNVKPRIAVEAMMLALWQG